MITLFLLEAATQEVNRLKENGEHLTALIAARNEQIQSMSPSLPGTPTQSVVTGEQNSEIAHAGTCEKELQHLKCIMDDMKAELANRDRQLVERDETITRSAAAFAVSTQEQQRIQGALYDKTNLVAELQGQIDALQSAALHKQQEHISALHAADDEFKRLHAVIDELNAVVKTRDHEVQNVSVALDTASARAAAASVLEEQQFHLQVQVRDLQQQVAVDSEAKTAHDAAYAVLEDEVRRLRCQRDSTPDQAETQDTSETMACLRAEVRRLKVALEACHISDEAEQVRPDPHDADTRMCLSEAITIHMGRCGGDPFAGALLAIDAMNASPSCSGTASVSVCVDCHHQVPRDEPVLRITRDKDAEVLWDKLSAHDKHIDLCAIVGRRRSQDVARGADSAVQTELQRAIVALAQERAFNEDLQARVDMLEIHPTASWKPPEPEPDPAAETVAVAAVRAEAASLIVSLRAALTEATEELASCRAKQDLMDKEARERRSQIQAAVANEKETARRKIKEAEIRISDLEAQLVHARSEVLRKRAAPDVLGGSDTGTQAPAHRDDKRRSSPAPPAALPLRRSARTAGTVYSSKISGRGNMVGGATLVVNAVEPGQLFGLTAALAQHLHDVEAGSARYVTIADLGMDSIKGLQPVDSFLQILSALMTVRADVRFGVFGLWILCHCIYFVYLIVEHLFEHSVRGLNSRWRGRSLGLDPLSRGADGLTLSRHRRQMVVRRRIGLTVSREARGRERAVVVRIAVRIAIHTLRCSRSTDCVSPHCLVLP